MAYVISDDCIACGTCIDECPVGAISLAQNVELVLTFVLLKQFTWDNRIVCMTHNKGILLGEFPYFFVLEEAWKNALAFELKCKYVLIKT